ncbi:FAD-dependent oxidoreductase [Streptomyces sp. CAU 1734]|uniref:NAD(P)/FAD-dependent oxidoreductase n=1 Tax=Streptomyces sp. CAU 1734 TaxID=3140360 RepID=UPI003261565B
MTPSQKHTRPAEQPHVIVLGAGYAGLLAALRLAPHARVTLIDPSDRFTERVRLHELAARRPDVGHPLTRLLRGTGIRHIARRATGLDPAARRVTTDDGRIHDWDRLVYALGSRTPETAGEHVHTAESAAGLGKRLRGTTGTLAVVGGGLTGIEMAAELAETHTGWRVRLLSSGQVAAGHSARGRAHVRRVLAARGVSVEEGERVTSPDAVDADAVLWSAAMVPNTALAADAGLTLDPRTHRIAVDENLRSLSHPEILAAGDSAAAHSPLAGSLRMGCAAALPTGSHAAAVIAAESLERTPKPLGFRYSLQCVSLGRHDGLIQFVNPDDTPRDRILTGRPAALVKEQIVRATVHTLRLARSRPGALSLLPGL